MANKKILIKINGKNVEAREGDMVLPVALDNGFEIPYFCYHKDLAKGGSCMSCLVEVQDPKRGKWVTTSCNLRVKDGMEILLDTPEVKRLRKQNMEMLFGGHLYCCDLHRNNFV